MAGDWASPRYHPVVGTQAHPGGKLVIMGIGFVLSAMSFSVGLKRNSAKWWGGLRERYKSRRVDAG